LLKIGENGEIDLVAHFSREREIGSCYTRSLLQSQHKTTQHSPFIPSFNTKVHLLPSPTNKPINTLSLSYSLFHHLSIFFNIYYYYFSWSPCPIFPVHPTHHSNHGFLASSRKSDISRCSRRGCGRGAWCCLSLFI